MVKNQNEKKVRNEVAILGKGLKVMLEFVVLREFFFSPND